MRNNTGEKPFPLKGFIAANGVTDFDTDPFISTVDAYFHQGAIPLDLYRSWNEQGCRVYWMGVKPDRMPGTCRQVHEKINGLVGHMFIYDMLEMNEEPRVGESGGYG